MKKVMLFCFLVFLLSSCEEEPCDKVVCENDGICNLGICQCVGDYWGENCEFTPPTHYKLVGINVKRYDVDGPDGFLWDHPEGLPGSLADIFIKIGEIDDWEPGQIDIENPIIETEVIEDVDPSGSTIYMINSDYLFEYNKGYVGLMMEEDETEDFHMKTLIISNSRPYGNDEYETEFDYSIEKYDLTFMVELVF